MCVCPQIESYVASVFPPRVFLPSSDQNAHTASNYDLSRVFGKRPANNCHFVLVLRPERVRINVCVFVFAIGPQTAFNRNALKQSSFKSSPPQICLVAPPSDLFMLCSFYIYVSLVLSLSAVHLPIWTIFNRPLGCEAHSTQSMYGIAPMVDPSAAPKYIAYTWHYMHNSNASLFGCAVEEGL